jgi:hypothetical protein
MFASLWDRFSEDPGGFLLLGAIIAAVFLLLERLLRLLWRRRELEEDQQRHRVANELPRTFEVNGKATIVKLEDDVQEDEVIKQ